MNPSLPSWELYETFLSVLEGGSLSAASRVLGVAQPTVRRRLEALEANLGSVLFTRGPAGLTPTEAALTTRPHAEAMAAAAAAMVRSLSAPPDEARGTVRVTCSRVVGVEVLPEFLQPLLRAHPTLQVELSLSNQTQDLLRRDADVAVRMVAPTQAALVARKAGTIHVGFFARAEVLGSRAPKRLAELLDFPLIGADRERGFFEALQAAGLPLTARDLTVRTDDDVAQLAAIRAGLGIGVCQVALATRWPELVRVLPGLQFPLETWVVMHEDLRRVRRVRLVFEHLVTHLTAYARSSGSPRARG
jgi:DNA-binding transcriptional LysR family regulator